MNLFSCFKACRSRCSWRQQCPAVRLSLTHFCFSRGCRSPRIQDRLELRWYGSKGRQRIHEWRILFDGGKHDVDLVDAWTEFATTSGCDHPARETALLGLTLQLRYLPLHENVESNTGKYT